MVGISTKLHAEPTTETASGAGQRKAETLVDVVVSQRVEEFLKIEDLLYGCNWTVVRPAV